MTAKNKRVSVCRPWNNAHVTLAECCKCGERGVCRKYEAKTVKGWWV